MEGVSEIARIGIKNALHAQAINSNNLANVNTTGFKASLSLYINGTNNPANVRVQNGVNLSEGTIVNTGRNLDVAVVGKGFIAVQSANGKEVYTRGGSLRVTPTGQLVTSSGRPVLGTAGPIAVPPFEKIDIGADGTVTVRPLGQAANVLTVAGRIKLVSSEGRDLVKGEDGNLVAKDGKPLPVDATVNLTSGALENSNVSAIGSMVNMIETQRHYEALIKLLRTVKDDAENSLQLVRTS